MSIIITSPNLVTMINRVNTAINHFDQMYF